jgi:peptide/nickel transport system substrate-binding protein
MKRTKRVISTLLAMVMVMVGFAGCTPAAEPEAQEPVTEVASTEESTEETVVAKAIKNPDTFVEATRNSIETLDLHFMSSSATTTIAYNVYDSLLANKSGTKLEPSLSVEVPTVENGLIKVDAEGKNIIVFPIRQDVKFHNGAVLTPEDVEYTFTRGIVVGSLSNLCQALTGQGSFNGLVDAVGLEEAYAKLDEAIQVEGENVVFKLDHQFSPFLDVIADNGSSYGILNKAWCLEQGAWNGQEDTVADFINITDENNSLHDKMMGTGPFKLESWEQGERLTLAKFDDYWNGPAKIDRIVREIVVETSVAIQKLQNGDVDFVNLSLADLQQVEGYEGIKVVKDMPASQLIKMNFNFDMQGDKYLGNKGFGPEGTPSNFFSDLDVRKGFSYAFDYETFINDVLLGGGMKPYGPVLVGYPTANPDNPQYTFDMDQATNHFKSAFGGELWDKGFKLVIPYSAGSVHRQRALEILQANLKSINEKFEIELISLPWAAYVGSIKDKEMPISIFGILPEYRHPYCSLSYHMHSEDFYAGVEGYTDLAKAKYDPLIEELGQSFDEERIKALSYELQRLSYEDALSIFHYQVIGQVAMQECVQGYEPQLFPFLVDYYNIYKE